MSNEILIPNERQLNWYKRKTAFIHFSINTFTGNEWGDGSESPKLFNPTDLDCEQWMKVLVNAGFTNAILTAKHHDGFCLWPSKYTEHSVKNSPYKNGNGDVVREFVDACKKYGIKRYHQVSTDEVYGDLPLPYLSVADSSLRVEQEFYSVKQSAEDRLAARIDFSKVVGCARDLGEAADGMRGIPVKQASASWERTFGGYGSEGSARLYFRGELEIYMDCNHRGLAKAPTCFGTLYCPLGKASGM